MRTAVQQSQLRTVVKKEDSAAAALKAMKDCGYDGIELNRFMLHPLPWHIRMFTKMAGMEMGAGGNLDWPKLVKESGLEVIALHCDLGTLEKSTQEVIEEAKSYGTDTIVLTGMYHYDYSDAQAVRELINRLNEVGKNLKKENISFLYHNHNCEFLNVDDTKKAYDLIIEETDPACVNFEFDSYWAIETGCDPLVWMKKLGSRMKLYHINDRGNRPMGKQGSILKSDGMELGMGNMNLPAYIEQAKENNCDAIILEMHRNWIDNDPVKSFRISREYLEKQV